MVTFILRRILSLLLTLVFASLGIFILLDLVPGDPASFILGVNATPETLAALQEQLGYHVSPVQRYMDWIWGILHGDFGRSALDQAEIGGLIGKRLTVSFPLALQALILTMLMAIPLGVLSAMKYGTRIDTTVMAISQIGISVPDFWFALLLLWFFSIMMGLFPIGGFPGWETGLFSGMQALFLPSFALAVPQFSILTRVVRSSLCDVMPRDYMQAVAAKGASNLYILYRHGLANIFVPVLNIIGLQFSSLLASAIVVESIFSLPGLGHLIFQAVAQRDIMVVRSVVFLLVFVVILVNFLVDLASAVADPRLRRKM